MNQQQKRIQQQTSKERKRMSRSNESCATNALGLLFITHLNATVTYRKTKKSKATIKMYLPESIHLNGTLHDQLELCKFSDLFIQTVLKEEPVDVTTMDDKQYNRSKEAQINNGLLYLLQKLGFSFQIKQTKKSIKTEKLVRISSLKTPSGQEFTSTTLEIVGLEFSKVMEDMFGRDLMISLSRDTIPLERFPQLMVDESSFPLFTNVADTKSDVSSTAFSVGMSNQQEYNQTIQQYHSEYQLPILSQRLQPQENQSQTSFNSFQLHNTLQSPYITQYLYDQTTHLLIPIQMVSYI